MSVDSSLREVELRNPHKARHLSPLDSAMNLADDFFMDDDSDEMSKKVGPTVWDHILLNRPVKVVFAMLIAVLVVPTLLYGFMYGLAKEKEPFGSCVILDVYWSECMPGQQPSQIDCINAGCCWNRTMNFCHHSLPARQNYRFASEALPNPEAAPAPLVSRFQRSPLGKEPLALNLTTAALGPSHVLIQLIAKKSDSSSFAERESKAGIVETDIAVELSGGEAFFLTIKRRSDNEVLFSTDNGPLVATAGFWEWSMQFPEDALLLGSGATSRGSLQLTSGSSTLYQGLGRKANGRPFILCVSQSGKSHGVLFEAPGAIEVVARPTNLVSIRSTAGAQYLNVHAFVGNSTAQVFDALTSYIGRPKMPPYWALGLHVCRDGARNATNELALQFSEEARRLDLPYDSDCVDDSALGNVSYVVEDDRKKKLEGIVTELEKSGRHFLLSLFAQVSVRTDAFEEGYAQGIFLDDTESRQFVGLHRDETVAYPDFDNPNVKAWLEKQMRAVLNNITDSMPSGIVLPDNWPLNENLMQGDGPERPHYVPQGLDNLSNGTVLWNSVGEGNGEHHEVHNQYGSLFASAVEDIFTAFLEENVSTAGMRLPILGASNWMGSRTGGWLGEEQQADWKGLKAALLSVLEAGISGEPFSGGGPICGSSGAWLGSLCTRWSLLALTTFPLTRFHHRWGSSARDPAALDESSGRIVARAARLRYELMPYLYTHLHQASLTGMPLVRPMAVEFATDNATWTLEEQFMVGPSLMAAPVFEPAAVSLTIYLPRSTETWFHLQGGERVQDFNGTGQVTLYAPENELILLLREGHIIAMQDAGNSSKSSRTLPRHIIVALLCEKSTLFDCRAKGTLFLDDGVSTSSNSGNILFSANEASLTISPIDEQDFCSLEELSTEINSISIYGLPGRVENVTDLQVNGVPNNDAVFNIDAEEGRVRISQISVDWCENTGTSVSISWKIQYE